MKEKAEAMVLASFVADSLALGVHWIYDVEEIDRRFGRVEQLLAPAAGSYHSSRQRGEFTHYGDQVMVLLESVAARSGFDPDDFAQRWKALFKNYDGYVDHATQGTLKNFSAGKSPAESGAPSSDFAGAARIAPLAFFYGNDLEQLVRSARMQTVMTHKHPEVIRDAEFLARVVFRVLAGERPTAAMESVRDEFFGKTPIAEAVTEGIASASADTRQTILKFGQSCNTRGALPSFVHLVARYEDDLKEALIENVMAGGDSAARGLAAGMILGAHLGPGAVPEEWLASLKRRGHIMELLETIDRSA
ncbi:MAG: ADP-ribosylglycohydrolase family protein [Desulfobacteraceae bacterium]|nr:ADP-ribosylglycohydrolase family protein [Desulfobacteraceae bacterium]